MSNLQGAIVKYYVSEEEAKLLNNNQRSCPALVLTDWSPDVKSDKDKCLNLKVMYDGMHSDWKTSVSHCKDRTVADGEEYGLAYSWDFLDKDKIQGGCSASPERKIDKN